MKLNIGIITMKISKAKQSLVKSHLICNPFYLLLALVILCSHDLYLKMDTYFFQPNQEATLSLYNGTFEKSENLITRDRMLDASIVSQGKKVAINPAQWRDQDSTISQLTFNTGEGGTYVAGVSTKARNIELAAEDFNSYLEHDGVLDMIEERTENDLLDQDAVESYEKHVKAIFQVGENKTNVWSTVFGYPIEFVPQANPYNKYSGENLEVQLLLNGKPLPNQLVFADFIQKGHSHTHGDNNHEHDHSAEEAHTHTTGQQLRTNDKGLFVVDLPEDGIYYLRTIYMTNATDSDELTHRSKWATLTFEVTHKHGSDSQTHDHTGIPVWVFLIGGLLVAGLLYLFVRKSK